MTDMTVRPRPEYCCGACPAVEPNPDELEALPHRTIIRDNAGVMFQRIVHGWYQAGDTSVHRSDDNFVCLPATVLWEPEA